MMNKSGATSVAAVGIAQNASVSLHGTTRHVGSGKLNQTFLLGGIMSDDVREVFLVINYALFCGILSIFGTTTNVINIIVFVKTGFKDAVNISFLALAISDLGCCFTLVIIALCFNPYFVQLDLPFEPFDFQYLTSGTPHITFSRITSCITAFVTFERCLCVAFPLKVKDIVTPKRAAVFLTCVSVAVVLFFVPVYLVRGLDWRYDAAKNISVLVLVHIDEYADLNAIAKPIQGIFVPFATFIVVVVSTVVLALNLRRKAKWREGTAGTDKSSDSALSARDAKVSKIVVVIATMFIVCYIPVCISYITTLFVPEYQSKGRYRNIRLVVFSFHFLTETLNSALNIFIYYRVSSVYKTIFRQLFGLKTKEEQL